MSGSLASCCAVTWLAATSDAQQKGRALTLPFALLDTPRAIPFNETDHRLRSAKVSFTGRRWAQFINDDDTDYENARTIINGHHKAETIADMARRFSEVFRLSMIS
jgi:hypothetical protein